MLHSNLITNRKWAALMVAMALMGILSLMMILLLEKIVPTSRAIRWVENSTAALYHSTSAIEKGMAGMNYKMPGQAAGAWNIWFPSSSESANFTILQNDTLVPSPGKWNSEYDPNWNRLWSWRPAQLILSDAFITWTAFLDDVQIDLRMPRLWSSDTSAGSSQNTSYFTGSSLYSVATVSLYNWSKNFSADFSETVPTWCTASDVQNRGLSANRINSTIPLPTLGNFCVKDLSNGQIAPLKTLLALPANASFCTSGCTLKVSVVNRLENGLWDRIPYLEYRLRNNAPFWSEIWACFLEYPPANSCTVNLRLWQPVALPFTTISSEWVSFWFRRTNQRSLQQITTGEEFDFTVFQ